MTIIGAAQRHDPVLRHRRMHEAEEVCWTLLLMMDLGGLEIDKEWRDFLADSMTPWLRSAVASGEMR